MTDPWGGRYFGDQDRHRRTFAWWPWHHKPKVPQGPYHLANNAARSTDAVHRPPAAPQRQSSLPPGLRPTASMPEMAKPEQPCRRHKRAARPGVAYLNSPITKPPAASLPAAPSPKPQVAPMQANAPSSSNSLAPTTVYGQGQHSPHKYGPSGLYRPTAAERQAYIAEVNALQEASQARLRQSASSNTRPLRMSAQTAAPAPTQTRGQADDQTKSSPHQSLEDATDSLQELYTQLTTSQAAQAATSAADASGAAVSVPMERSANLFAGTSAPVVTSTPQADTYASTTANLDQSFRTPDRIITHYNDGTPIGGGQMPSAPTTPSPQPSRSPSPLPIAAPASSFAPAPSPLLVPISKAPTPTPPNLPAAPIDGGQQTTVQLEVFRYGDLVARVRIF